MSHGPRWRGAAELGVELDTSLDIEGARGLASGALVRALAYPSLVGVPDVGTRVLLNVTALARGLGTGGYALVVAPTDPLPADPPPSPGHLVKARYTPLQAMVLGVDDQESEHHETLRDADDLAGLPVVVADLHSALPAIIAGARFSAALHGLRAPRVAYVMTDGGALPAGFSRTVAGLADAGWIDASLITDGPFGIGLFRPRMLFNLAFDPLTHGVIWSLLANSAVYVAVSLVRPPSPIERMQAATFVTRDIPLGTAPGFRLWRTAVTVGEVHACPANVAPVTRIDSPSAMMTNSAHRSARWWPSTSQSTVCERPRPGT